MDHIKFIRTTEESVRRSFVVNATGRYYTHASVAGNMSKISIDRWTRKIEENEEMRLLDPFGGDGRLAIEFIKAWIVSDRPSVRWNVTLWDLSEYGFLAAKNS